ncbi:ribosomal maturation YjgA family protein [Streptosporangium sandarakinum]|uniref:DUF2809 domain-containing protein n=1 Tax=Streptosporangium sandarakinum TaxID=1260955 RepID=A0A852V1Y2_9ACTN|nr:DUF2809 domain-containing protein [Streptosporangium sandarakinum]NYF43877.1 hypothetical protein [Streptosporangium sandarakinum]
MPAAPHTSPRTPPPAGRPRRFEAVRARLPAVLAVAVTVAAGLGIRAVTGGWFGKYAGDALYTVLVHALVVAAVPRVSPFRAAACALAFSWAVEFAQLTPIPAALSEASVLARLVLGSTFGAADLIAYAAGALLSAAAHTAAVAVRARRGRRAG